MISWMAARSDFPDYGKMLFYQLPKEKLIYGPMQIEDDRSEHYDRPATDSLGPKRVESHSWKPDRGTDRELLYVCGAGVPDGGRHRLPPTQARNRDLGGQSGDGAYARRGNPIRLRDAATPKSGAGSPRATGLRPGEGAIR